MQRHYKGIYILLTFRERKSAKKTRQNQEQYVHVVPTKLRVSCWCWLAIFYSIVNNKL